MQCADCLKLVCPSALLMFVRVALSLQPSLSSTDKCGVQASSSCAAEVTCSLHGSLEAAPTTTAEAQRDSNVCADHPPKAVALAPAFQQESPESALPKSSRLWGRTYEQEMQQARASHRRQGTSEARSTNFLGTMAVSVAAW